MFLRSKCVAKPTSSPLLLIPVQPPGIRHLHRLFISPLGGTLGDLLAPKQHKLHILVPCSSLRYESPEADAESTI